MFVSFSNMVQLVTNRKKNIIYNKLINKSVKEKCPCRIQVLLLFTHRLIFCASKPKTIEGCGVAVSGRAIKENQTKLFFKSVLTLFRMRRRHFSGAAVSLFTSVT